MGKAVASVSATLAEAGEFDAKGEHASEYFDAGRNRHLCELGSIEVTDDSAADADVVVVRIWIGIEVDGLAELSVGGDQVAIVKQPQSAVDGVERKIGHARADCVIDRFRIGMIGARGDLTEDREALVSEPESSFAGGAFEALDTAVNFDRIQFHG